MHFSELFKCSKGTYNGKCDQTHKLEIFSRPILMQHYPLFRDSDKDCDEPDSAPYPLKNERFREKWDCLSKEATAQLLRQLHPRIAISGHTHHGCTRPLQNGEGIEITLPSFSWRNKKNPSYGLAVFTPNNYAFNKCAMPNEVTVVNLYCFGAVCLIVWLLYSYVSHVKLRKLKRQ